MNAHPTSNEGFRMLEESVHVEGPLPGAPPAGSVTNQGMCAVEESVWIGDVDADYKRQRTDALIAMVERLGTTLTPDALCSIHDIALHRVAQRQDADPQQAEHLTQLVMRVAAARLSSQASP